MVKKKWRLVVSTITVLLIVMMIVCVTMSSLSSLSQTEIEKRRELYPINDRTPAHIELFPSSLEEGIRRCDTYVEAEIVSEPKCVSYGTQFTFVTYEIKIIQDVFDSFDQDVVEIYYNDGLSVCFPDMKIGDRFIMGGIYKEKREALNIGASTMFYVTEDGYVFSVQSEESKDRHTGSTVKKLINYIQSVKKESTSE